MESSAHQPIAIVGVGAVLPDAPNAAAFWDNIKQGRYSISETPKERWDAELYYDADPAAPDKTYSKIGGWVREYAWEPMKWRMPIPPCVAEAMDPSQQWAIACTREALEDFGYPKRALDLERTAVILGNAMGGEKHYRTVLRTWFPELALDLEAGASFASLPEALQKKIVEEFHQRLGTRLPPITEDTMPGELSNCIAGRIANLYNFRGPNFTADAACASAMAAMCAAVEGLSAGDFDAAITGGIDRNMSASTFIKFCKIGALSATGSRPYAEGADGFVMGEGAAIFLMKRLAEAERESDRIYAVLRGIGGSSDGKGKGITAPNPVGQRLAMQRGWKNAGLSPATATLIEGHGTSTRVGDLVEVESMLNVLGSTGLAAHAVALGSVKSNIGHLKSAAGAAGLLKATLAIHEKVLPPSVKFHKPNPGIDFEHSPIYVNTELRPWTMPDGKERRAGVSAFGFGGTNFHIVLEEFVPGKLNGNGRKSVAVPQPVGTPVPVIPVQAAPVAAPTANLKAPVRGAMVLGAESATELATRLRTVQQEAEQGQAPEPRPPREFDLRAPERIAIDYGNASELAERCAKAIKALEANQPALWKAVRQQGVFRGSGAPGKVAFLYPGQGSQYVNMLRTLRETEPIVAQTFAEADATMTPLLGKPLTEFIFVDEGDAARLAKAEDDLRQTAITQPAVLAVDCAITRLLAAYGIVADMTMGHSLGEYAALVAAGALPLSDALEAVSARGREMTRVSMADNGRMAAVIAPMEEIERILKTIDGYVVIANINSSKQAVIGGASQAVEKAIEVFQAAGYMAVPLSVSHAFHTSIVAPASGPLREVLSRLRLQPSQIPVIANVDGKFYPQDADAREAMLDILARQVAAPVQFIQGLRTLYEAGARVFVEAGPKKALQGFADDVLGEGGVLALFTNNPKMGDLVSFNQALCGLYAAGLGRGEETAMEATIPAKKDESRYEALGRMVADVLERGWFLYEGGEAWKAEPVVITGAALGLPGTERVFDDGNVGRILRGEQFLSAIPERFRELMLDKHVVRLVKSDAGGPTFETISEVGEVIKLAGRERSFDLEEEFGVSGERIAALDVVTQLAIGAGLDALRDAGIPLVMRYKTTSKGTQLPDRWMLPEALRDDTGVIFASAFPGYDAFALEMKKYYTDRERRHELAMLEDLKKVSEVSAETSETSETFATFLEKRIENIRGELEKEPYTFDRRFLFRVLAMGHSQFAEFIGARGPNTQINAACASTTQAMSLAGDWLRERRCRRVLIISADNVTSDNMLEWIGAGFLATGAAATDERVEEAAIPFDRRRHGMLIGMGAAAMVVETAAGARQRGLRPICEMVASVSANSAFHATRLDVEHISAVMEKLISQAEATGTVRREEIAPRTMFMSHETYTPARGGSASAEIHALRRVFGATADRIVIANTKGFTGHAMGTGIEDVVAIKGLETGTVPPVPNFKEVDPELGALNLSKGGEYPVEYALRLAAGFGSQIAMTLLRWAKTADGAHRAADRLGYGYRVTDQQAWSEWLRRISGQDAAELEVVRRTLRVKDRGLAARTEEARRQDAGATKPAETPRTRETFLEALPRIVEEVAPARVLVSQAATRAAAAAPARVQVAVQAAPEAAKAAVVATPVAVDAESVKQRLLQLVTEKTGYPPEMLDLDLDLEADLGVDTVKQAELFAAIREIYGIARDPNLKLRDFPTLAHVIRFVMERRPGTAVAAEVTVQEKVAGDAKGARRQDAGATKDVSASPPRTVEAVAVNAESVKQRLLQLVTEKTGYPPEMLDLDLDLEADLGVDTVKQAELFAAIREIYGIARDPNLKLRDFPTLAHVIRFVMERRPGAGVTADGKAAEKAAEDAKGARRQDAGATVARPVLRDFSATEKIPRRVPVPVLRPALAQCKPTGVKLQAGMRVAILPDRGGVADALKEQLRALGVEVLMLTATADCEALKAQITPLSATGPVQGVFWLPALDDEAVLKDLGAWHEAIGERLKALYTAMGALYEQIAAPGTFLLSGLRLGGQHGYDKAGAVSPLGGAVAGFTKTYKRERLDATVKAVDFEAGRPAAEIAKLLIAEAQRDPGAVEIGYKDGLRWAVGLREEPAADGRSGLTLNQDTVFVVTGAAGSIVSAITADLAAASGGTFYLLDLVPQPDPANPDLKRFVSDKEGLKRDLFGRIQGRGERATPALVEKELAALERQVAAQSAIDAVVAAGGTVHYCAVNLTDAEAVAKVVEQVRKSGGRIDVLLHAAGMERSHLLPAKERREFDLVFDVKVDGWFNLLHAIGEMPLGAVVAFSSVAARFGNAGQTDYSSANDLLCKMVSALRRGKPGTRAIAIDWTAWAGMGMATRGSIPQMMQVAGIDMLPSEAGIPLIRRELTSGGTRGEIVIGERLGIMLGEWEPSGGMEVEVVEPRSSGPMLEKVAASPIYRGTIFETRLDPALQPFLHDHQIDGTPVLPGVMGIEAFAEAAAHLLPGWRVEAVEDVNFLAPFKFYKGEPRTVTIEATVTPDGDKVFADCRLIGRRDLPSRAEPQVTVHFTGRVRLMRQDGIRVETLVPEAPDWGVIESSDIYRVFFHGPAYRVLERGWRHENHMVGEMFKGLPANHRPPERPLLMAPRLIELCFQTAGLWEMAALGRFGLPLHVDQVVVMRPPEVAEGHLYAVVNPDRERGTFDAEVVDTKGHRHVHLVGYRTVALPTEIEPELLRPMQKLMSDVCDVLPV